MDEAIRALIRQSTSNKTLDMMSGLWFLVIPTMMLVWVTGFILSRLHMFQHEYNKLTQEYESNAWLIRQCEHDEFYHSLRHHSQLCDEVAATAHDSIVLNAAQRVARETYLSGYEPCSTILENLVLWIMGGGFLVTCGAVFAMLIIPTCLVPFIRYQYLVKAQQQKQNAIYDPYGRYQDTILYTRLPEASFHSKEA